VTLTERKDLPSAAGQKQETRPLQAKNFSTESIQDLADKVQADQLEMEERKKSGRRLAPFIEKRMEKRAAKLVELQRATDQTL